MADKSESCLPDENPIDVALAKYMQRIDAGENVDQNAFIAEHEEIADQLREY